MKRKVIFRKLVDGYKTQVRWKAKSRSISRTVLTASDKPIEIFGKVTVEEPTVENPFALKGVEIPDFDTKKIFLTSSSEKDEEIRTFSTIYPLIPRNPAKEEPIMAYAKIYWDKDKNSYFYTVVQPEVPQKLRRLINKLKELLEQRLDIDFNKLKKQEAKNYLKRETLRLLDYFKINLAPLEKDILNYYIERDFLGYGILEPIMNDPEIEDISCDGVEVPVFIFHRNPLLGSMPTNIFFSEKEELDSFLIRLAQLCGQSISVLDPLLEGTLPDGSRVQGTLSTDIARKGSNFTIRKFTERPLTPSQLLAYETIDVKSLAFLWLAVEHGSSILVSGGTASGKTVFLNALSLFIRPNMKIVSIEDTAELRLPHTHWVPQVSRVAISTDKEKERGKVDLFDLLRQSMRQRPDYIILGEVRGKEAYVLFQQMATGHPSFATIHADTMEKLVDRLTTAPIELPPSLMENLDLVIFLEKTRYKGRFVRKVKSIFEIEGFDRSKNIPIFREIFSWNVEKDTIDIKKESLTLRKIINKTGLSVKEVTEELKRRMLVLYWLQEKNITDYQDFSQIINLYYNYPDKVMEVIAGEL